MIRFENLPAFRVLLLGAGARAAVLVLLLIVGLSSPAFSAEAARPRLSVRILEMTQPGFEAGAIGRAVEAMSAALADYELDVRQDSLITQTKAALQGEGDIFIGTAGFFREMQERGFVSVATLTSDETPNPNEAAAGALVVRADAPFEKVESLQGRTAGATETNAFLNTQTVLGELARRGYDPDKFFSGIRLYGRSMGGVAGAVLRGEVDAGIVKAGLVEDMERSGALSPGSLRVLEPRGNDSMTLRHTSEAYPGWTVMTAPTVSPEVLRDVTLALFRMPGNERWLPATEFSRVDRLFRALRYGPYDYLNHWTLDRVWAEFQNAIVLLGALALFSVFHFFRSESVIRRKTAELAEALERIARLEKLSAAGELSTIVAHELLQPLSALRCFLATLSKSICRDSVLQTERLAKLCSQAQRTLEKSLGIVEKVRHFGKTKSFTKERLDLSRHARRTAEELVRGRVIPAMPRLSLFNAPVLADCLEMEILLTNLIRNASEASVAAGRFSVAVDTGTESGRSMLRVVNASRPLTDAERKALSTPLSSPKANGLGLGISIVRNIAERHDARVTFSETPAGEGLIRFTAEVTFPAGLEEQQQEEGKSK